MSLLDLIVATDIIGTSTDLRLDKTQQKAVRRVLRKMLDRHDAKWQPWYAVVKKLNKLARCHRLVRSDLAEVAQVARTCFGFMLAKPISRRVGYSDMAKAFTVEAYEPSEGR